MRHSLLLVLIIWGLMFLGASAYSQHETNSIAGNIEKGDKQSVLSGPIESLIIKRGPVEFRLGPGNLTIFDFGSGTPAGMTYKGAGSIFYAPPDEVEMYQLRRFTKSDTLRGAFDKITFFFTVELDNFPDTMAFTRQAVSKDAWSQLQDARGEAWEHMKLHLPNKLLGDLLDPGPGTYFYADFNLAKFDRLAFIEDPSNDDLYSLVGLVMITGTRTIDVLGGYSPDGDLPSQRGILPIDISHYEIDSDIKTGGEMMTKCRIHYAPSRWGRKFIYFGWYPDNDMISVRDSLGDTLQYITRKGEPGFGVILNQPAQLGQGSYLDFTYKCKAMENIWGVYYMILAAPQCWYPWNNMSDRATFDFTFRHAKDLEVAATGDSIETIIEGDQKISKWRIDKPVVLASFGYGAFESRDFIVPNIPPVRVFLSESIPHAELAQYLGSIGELSSGDMLGRVGADVTNSLAFYTSILGPCPFNSLKVTEIPMSFGQGPPGLIYLSWWTFQQESIAGNDDQFRAHEVSHQWWGHVINNESYRDTWIIEGLAQYSGFWFYQNSSQNAATCKAVLENWRDALISGNNVHSDGSKAGPPVMGVRLSSSKSNDYSLVVYEKGAYIFHMIRYLLHDYKTGSDDAFAAFLKDLAEKYNGKIVTTARLQKLLEHHAGGDMSWFFNQWVYGTEIPEYTFSYQASSTADSKYQVACHIKQEKVSPDFQMIVPLTVVFDDDKYINLKVLVDQPEMDIDLPILPLEPKKIVFNSYDAVLARVKYK